MNDKSMAQGGPPPLGPQRDLLEANFGPGQRFDPGRDVLNFWRYMIAAIMETFRTRRIPALEEFDGNPELERRVIECYKALIDACKVKVESYDQLITEWFSRVDDPEASDLIMKVFGRTIIQFYVECCLVRGIPGDQIWPLGMDAKIEEIVASPNYSRKGVSRWIRLRRLITCFVDLVRWW